MSSVIQRKSGATIVWSDIGRVPSHARGEIFTIAGRAFCVSGRSGNMAALGPQGFFSNDTRFLSGLRLLVNGVDPEVVDARAVHADRLEQHVLAGGAGGHRACQAHQFQGMKTLSDSCPAHR